MFEALLVAALLVIDDPAGDVLGGGDLQPPTAQAYRNIAPFDILQVTVEDSPQLVLTIELGSLTNTFDLPLGFSLPVVEVYVEGSGEGDAALLEGSGMSLPAGRGWEVAVRLTGEEAVAHRATPEGRESVTPQVVVDGNRLVVATPFPRPRRPQVYAMTGLYDLVGISPWRPLEESESPWAFSSATQRFPVVDVLARDEAAQRQAVASGVLLPSGASGRALPGSLWLILMAVGLAVSLAGLILRTVARRQERPAETAKVTPEPVPSDHAESEVAFARKEDSPLPEAPAPAEESGRREAPAPLRPFTWDSSALLATQEDELGEEFGEEFDQQDEGPNRGGWERPVPLPLERDDRQTGAGESLDEEPELVTEEDGTVETAGEAGSATGTEGASEAESDEGSGREREDQADDEGKGAGRDCDRP